MVFMNGPDFNVISGEGGQPAFVLLEPGTTCFHLAQSTAVAYQHRICAAHMPYSRLQPAAACRAVSGIAIIAIIMPTQQAVCASRPDEKHYTTLLDLMHSTRSAPAEYQSGEAPGSKVALLLHHILLTIMAAEQQLLRSSTAWTNCG
jgi:hypothetical protein